MLGTELLVTNFDKTGSFLAETGVVGAEGIFSYKSLGSRIAGLTIGHLADLAPVEVDPAVTSARDDGLLEAAASVSRTITRIEDL